MRLPNATRPIERQCVGKKGYRTKKAAKLHIRRMKARDGELCAYRCPHCRGFHVGHNYRALV